jgi:two-component system, chemotaxis family, protein-glutamate methylesterase/glutaminase
MGLTGGRLAQKAHSAATEPLVRVVIVEESAVVRGMLSRWLGDSGAFEVVARYGSDISIKERLSKLKAEVLVLDFEAEKMSGKAVLADIVERDETLKILTLSHRAGQTGHQESSMKVLGASGILKRPLSTRDLTTSKVFRDEFVKKVEGLGIDYRRQYGASRSKDAMEIDDTAKAEKARTVEDKLIGSTAIALTKPSTVPAKIIAVGSSTGGPKALYEVFEALRGKISVPVVVTQHMPPMFTGILAEHLSKASGLVAKEACDGEALKAGVIYVAPGDYHMSLVEKNGSVHLQIDQGPEENFCRPSADPMLRSVASIYGKKALCLILTGMGHDGCAGAKEIVKAGGTVVAQDEATSVVWGMPGAVAKAGVCSNVLPLKDIGPKVQRLLKGEVR